MCAKHDWTAESLFDVFATSLPRVAEEGALNKAIRVAQIERSLIDAMGCTEEEACHQRLIIERLLTALCVLDAQSLSHGLWLFVSFPAALLARNVFTTLANPGQAYFPQHYWEQGAHRPPMQVEEQRELLRTLETRRIRNCPADAAPLPIRVVHVAWGIIKLDGRFILLHRDDKSRVGQGNYVLPGGRFHPADWSGMSATDLPASQEIGTRLPPQVLHCTLAREFEEELSLRSPEHYTASGWRNVKPWRQIEGARNHHAYTEYLLSLFHIKLTEQGEIALYAAMAREACAWFSVEELAKQRQPDGATSYLDALLADFGDHFAATLSAIPESHPDSRPAGESDATDFPHAVLPLKRGKTGKEKPIRIELEAQEHGLLFGLAWHAKGLPFEDDDGAARFLRGWVALDGGLLDMASALARKLKAANSPLLEIVAGKYVRINLHPQCIFLDPAQFRFSLTPEDGNEATKHWQLDLQAEALTTPLGKTARVNTSIPVTRNTVRIVEAVAAGKDPETEPRIKSGDIQKTLRDQIDQPLRSFGLRKLVRIDAGVYCLNVSLADQSGSSPLEKEE